MNETKRAIAQTTGSSELIPAQILEPRKLKFAQMLGLALAKSWQGQSDQQQHQPRRNLIADHVDESNG